MPVRIGSDYGLGNDRQVEVNINIILKRDILPPRLLLYTEIEMALTFDDIQSHKYNYAFLAACVFLVLKFLIQSLLSPLRRVPGPFLARFTRLWEVYANHRCDFATYNIALHQRYGTFHDHPCSAQTTIGFVIAKKKKTFSKLIRKQARS